MSTVQIQAELASRFQEWHEKLGLLADLKDGWNGYTAPAPNQMSVLNGELFLRELRCSCLEPSRLAASAMGGVAVTIRQGDRKVLVECYNDGRIYALFSRRDGEMKVMPYTAAGVSLRALVEAVREYLDG